MAFIPKNARWFIGEFVESLQIEGQSSVLVHLNSLLIEARSAEEAFDKAMKLGADMNTEYVNTSGAKVVCRFEGLRELNVIHDELEHGAELSFRIMSDLEARQLSEIVTPKESLAVFRDTKASSINYFPASIAQELKERSERSNE